MSKSIRVSNQAYIALLNLASERRQTITVVVDDMLGVPVQGASGTAEEPLRTAETVPSRPVPPVQVPAKELSYESDPDMDQRRRGR